MRGATPVHAFDLPISADMVDEVEITYCQNDKVILQKYKRDCTVEDGSVSTVLSQEDTFEFDEDSGNVEIQIRVKDKNGKVHKSEIICVTCGRCLSDEVL